MINLPVIVLQGLLLIAVAPLVPGLMKIVSVRLRLGAMPRIYQPYLELHKLFRKQGSVPPNVSPVFRWAPVVIFVCYAVPGFVVPVFSVQGLPVLDLIGIAALLGLAKFTLCLTGFDVETPTGGLAASREMFLHVLIEPAFFALLFAITIHWGSTNPVLVVDSVQNAEPTQLPAVWLTLFALLFILLGENGRLPIDNPGTHLELTMFQKALGADYTTWRLALLHWADAVRLAFFLTLAINLSGLPHLAHPGDGFWPHLLAMIAWLVLLGLSAAVLAVWEATQSRRRLLRVTNFFFIGIGFSILALIVAIITGHN